MIFKKLPQFINNKFSPIYIIYGKKNMIYSTSYPQIIKKSINGEFL